MNIRKQFLTVAITRISSKVTKYKIRKKKLFLERFLKLTSLALNSRVLPLHHASLVPDSDQIFLMYFIWIFLLANWEIIIYIYVMYN